jgi:hypothetical protein
MVSTWYLQPNLYQFNRGWVCPVCGRGVAPHTNTCPCEGKGLYTTQPSKPQLAFTLPYTTDLRPVIFERDINQVEE